MDVLHLTHSKNVQDEMDARDKVSVNLFLDLFFTETRSSHLHMRHGALSVSSSLLLSVCGMRLQP